MRPESQKRLFVLLGGVFVLKLIALLQLREQPLLHADAGLDTSAYVELARKVMGGDLWLGPGLYFVSPLYIYFLAVSLAVFKSFTALRVLQVLLGTASAGFIFVTTAAWFGARAAWIATALAATTGLFTFYEILILQAAIDPFLTSAALLALTLALKPARIESDSIRPASETTRRDRSRRPIRRGRDDAGTKAIAVDSTGARRRTDRERWRFLAAGAIFGLATLNRPNMMIAAGGVAAVLLATRRIRPAFVLAAGVLAGVAPAAIRNLVVAHEWSLVSSHGGLNFYIGNSDSATGFYHPVPGIRPTIGGQEQDARRVAERAVGHALTDSQTSDYFFRLAWSWMGRHPGDALGLLARKLGYTLSAQHVALPHSYPFYAQDTLLRFLATGPWLLIPLGITGLVFAAPPAKRRSYLAWLAFAPAYAVSVATFFVAERYRLPLLVPLCIGSGAALDAVISAIDNRRPSTLLAPGLVFAGAFALVNYPYGLDDGRWQEGLRMTQRLVVLGRYDEADQWTARVESREPRPGASAYGIGSQLLLANQPLRALPHLTRARDLDPEQPLVAYTLGQAFLHAGRTADAIPHLRRGFDSGAEIPMGGYDLATALQSVGDPSGATAVLQRIKPGDLDDPELVLRLGRLASQCRAADVAEAFFQHAVALRPFQASARQQLGLNLLVLGRFGEAAQELAEAVRLDPRDSDALSHLAYCELKVGRPVEARAHADAALALNPDDPLARQVVALGRR